MIPRIAILISGRGSNMVALAESVCSGVLAGCCEIAAVISSRPGVPGLAKAQELGLPIVALDARALGKEAYDAALLLALRTLGRFFYEGSERKTALFVFLLFFGGSVATVANFGNGG